MKDYKNIIYVIPILLTIIGIVFLTSFRSNNSNKSVSEPLIEPMSVKELSEWSSRNDTIFRKDSVVAIFEHYEYELNPNHRKPKMLAEICFIQVDDEPQNTIDLIRFIHTIHSSSKIQVEFKYEYDRIKKWSNKID